MNNNFRNTVFGQTTNPLLLGIWIGLLFVSFIHAESRQNQDNQENPKKHHHDHGHHHDYSHGEHHHHEEDQTVSEEEVLVVSGHVLSALVKQQYKVGEVLLDSAWIKIPTQNKRVHKKGKDYYIVSFAKNSKTTLYLLLSDTGEPYDVNFTGVFEGLQ